MLMVSDQEVPRCEKSQCEMPGPADGLLRFVYLDEIGSISFRVRTFFAAALTIHSVLG